MRADQASREPEQIHLEGELVVLRSKKIEDARTDYEWRTDPELAKLDATRPITLTLDEYTRYHTDDVRFPSPWSVRLAIETHDGRHIGNCMYYDVDWDKRQAELGIMIGDREFWGKGYGTDAVRTLLRHVFTEIGLERIYLHTLVSNKRARRAFEKAGFEVVGEVRRDSYDFVKMEAWSKDWEAAHPEAASDNATPKSGTASDGVV